jgi:hypothetical protein
MNPSDETSHTLTKVRSTMVKPLETKDKDVEPVKPARPVGRPRKRPLGPNTYQPFAAERSEKSPARPALRSRKAVTQELNLPKLPGCDYCKEFDDYDAGGTIERCVYCGRWISMYRRKAEPPLP